MSSAVERSRRWQRQNRADVALPGSASAVMPNLLRLPFVASPAGREYRSARTRVVYIGAAIRQRRICPPAICPPPYANARRPPRPRCRVLFPRRGRYAVQPSFILLR